MKELLYVTVCDEVPFAGCKQQLKSLVFEEENDNSQHRCHGKDTEQHPAEHFEVSAEGHGVRVFFGFVLFHNRGFSKRKGSEIIRQSQYSVNKVEIDNLEFSQRLPDERRRHPHQFHTRTFLVIGFGAG